MKFSVSSIQLTNFRQYRGTHTVELEYDRNKNVTVVLGQNGAGKSNLLNAITWCLYGIEAHKEKDEYDAQGMPLINTTALNEMGTNETAYAEVIISLDTDRGPWVIKRRITGRKNGLGRFVSEPKSQLTVIHTRGDQNVIETGEQTQIYINNLLPEALRGFFFIDGEQLREFFKVSTQEKIEDAIDIVSQLALLYKSAGHLQKYRNKLRTGVKDTSPRLADVQRRIQDFQKRIDDCTDANKADREEIKKLEADLQDIEQFLKNYNVGTIAQLQAERERIEGDIRTWKISIDENETKRNHYLVEIAPFIYLKDTLEQAYAIIEDKVDKGELPARIKETFVEELLERGVCICGNELSGRSREVLDEYRKRLALSELSEVTIAGKLSIAEILDQIKEFPEKMDGFNATIDSLKAQLNRTLLRKEQITKEISSHDIEEIQRKEDRRKQLERAIEKRNTAILLRQSDIDVYKKERGDLEAEELRELAKDKKNALLKAKLALVQDSLEVLALAEETIKAKIRKQVESNTQKNFLTLIRKKEAFKAITIDDNYSVRVEHAHGYNVINDLSAGEYLILGLSFMSALMTISGFHAPVLIDTPLGKIDDEHREHITRELPKFLKDTQLILLVTPTEYDENVRKNLAQYLLPENFYEICENETKTESMVVSNGCKA